MKTKPKCAANRGFLMALPRTRKWKDYVSRELTYNEGERCPALNTYGYQCEGHQGHEGKHWTLGIKAYWKHAHGYVDEEVKSDN